MSKPKTEWKGHNCVQCKSVNGKPAKLARMQCQAWIGGDDGHECGRFVCAEHGHKVGKLAVCNRCQPARAGQQIKACAVEPVPLF